MPITAHGPMIDALELLRARPLLPKEWQVQFPNRAGRNACIKYGYARIYYSGRHRAWMVSITTFGRHRLNAQA